MAAKETASRARWLTDSPRTREERAAIIEAPGFIPPSELGEVAALAAADHAAYPQYEGHWEGPEWKLVVVRSEVKTKLGTAFKAGDVTIGKRGWGIGSAWTLYSWRNAIDTSVTYGVERLQEASA